MTRKVINFAPVTVPGLRKHLSLGYVDTYIVNPTTVWGIADQELVKEGISNPHSIQVPALIRASLGKERERERAGMVGEGKNIWHDVYFDDCEWLIELI